MQGNKGAMKTFASTDVNKADIFLETLQFLYPDKFLFTIFLIFNRRIFSILSTL